MIIDTDLVKRAEAFVKANKREDVPADVATLMASYERVRDAKANDGVVFAHARPLVNLVSSLGIEERTEKPAKKTASGRGRRG